MGDITDTAFSDTEIQDLRDIVGIMIPADATLGMPGADDPAILADIVASLGRDLGPVREAVSAIVARPGGAFATMDIDGREGLIGEYVANGGTAGAALARVVLSAYYRDDRVLLALGMEPRAPFPKGHVLEQGDWSLLDPVRRRAPFWRRDR